MSNLNEPLLTATDVHVSFQDSDQRLSILSGVQLQLLPGERIAIVGASGSGKSTLLHVLAGLMHPDAGSIHLFGTDLSRQTDTQLTQMRRESLGFVYQFHHLLAEFTALENVCMPLLLTGVSPSVAKAQGLVMLEQLGLSARAHHYSAQLSGGERQRVAIARALVNQPACILADEPTGNLDDQSADCVMETLLAACEAQSAGLVIVTHDMAIASKMDYTYLLMNGMLELK